MELQQKLLLNPKLLSHKLGEKFLGMKGDLEDIFGIKLDPNKPNIQEIKYIDLKNLYEFVDLDSRTKIFENIKFNTEDNKNKIGLYIQELFLTDDEIFLNEQTNLEEINTKIKHKKQKTSFVTKSNAIIRDIDFEDDKFDDYDIRASIKQDTDDLFK